MFVSRYSLDKALSVLNPVGFQGPDLVQWAAVEAGTLCDDWN